MTEYKKKLYDHQFWSNVGQHMEALEHSRSPRGLLEEVEAQGPELMNEVREAVNSVASQAASIFSVYAMIKTGGKN